MLTKAELREMQVRTGRTLTSTASHEDWVHLAALTLIFQGDAIVTQIAAEGLDTFKDRAQDIYAVQNFGPGDLVLIYSRVCDAAQRAMRDRVH